MGVAKEFLIDSLIVMYFCLSFPPLHLVCLTKLPGFRAVEVPPLRIVCLMPPLWLREVSVK
jgi:hypothetical protein